MPPQRRRRLGSVCLCTDRVLELSSKEGDEMEKSVSRASSDSIRVESLCVWIPE